MKRLIIGGLSLLLVVSVKIPTASAQKIGLNSVTLNNTASSHLTPFNLVSLAQQGYFKSQGIPSSDALKVACQDGHVSAEDLVKSAVAANRLSPQALNDQKYLSEVNTLLRFLANNFY